MKKQCWKHTAGRAKSFAEADQFWLRRTRKLYTICKFILIANNLLTLVRFRTTLGDGLIAIAENEDEAQHFILSLEGSKLNLHSSLIDKPEGIAVGDKLNDTEWHEASIIVTQTHVHLGVDNRLQV